MARKLFPKALSVGLSLALCASLAMPGFAATFTELQGVIDNQQSLINEETQETRIGYEDGKVTLYENVTHEAGDGNKRITVSSDDGDVTLDLNGKTIDGNGEVGVILVDQGANLTIDDSSEAGNGKITGGKATYGGGIFVGKDAELTINGGEISGNEAKYNSGGVDIGDGSKLTMNGGKISENTAGSDGGGVGTNYNAEFTMNGGEISGNTSGSTGGGVGVSSDCTFTMNGGEISDNVTKYNGGGVSVGENGTFVMEDGKITGNSTQEIDYGGGGVCNSGDTTVNGGEISDNTADYGGGLFNDVKGTTTINGGEVSGNTANFGGGLYNQGTSVVAGGTLANNTVSSDGWGSDIFQSEGTLDLVDANEMNAELKEDGKAISGWYLDDSYYGPWNEGKYAYTEYEAGRHENWLTLKAAHDQYFQLVDEEGNMLAEVEKGTQFDVSSLKEPTRDGYNFTGWLVDGKPVDGAFEVTGEVKLEAQWEAIPAPVPPYVPGEVEINEPATPLASGPVTRAQFIDYLWRHEGEPASAGVCTFTDVTEEHEYFAALCWAEENGVAEAYLNDAPHVDGTFEPDELVTAGAVREFLDNFADVFGTNVVAALDLTTLAVDDEEAVLNCDEVLAEFFGEEYTSAKDEDLDIAA